MTTPRALCVPILLAVSMAVAMPGGAAGQGATDPPSPEMVAAGKAMAEGRWDDAVRGFDAVLARDPGSKRAAVGRALALIRMGKSTQGMDALRANLDDEATPERLAFVADFLDDGPGRPGMSDPAAQLYRRRAFDRAKALNYLSSGDPDRVELLARLALQFHDDAEFRLATAVLLRDHPGRMQTHYFNGLRAVMDEHWATADDEFRRAGELGLPPEMVEKIRASGIGGRATTNRSIRYAFIALGAWLAGLLGLFVVGRLLSAITLRTVGRGHSGEAITPTQGLIRRIYKGVINLAGMYYYISLPFVAIAAIGITVGLFLVVLKLPRIPIKLLAILAVFGFAMIAMIFSSIRSLFVRIRDDDPGKPLTREQAPRVWVLVEEVAARVGTRPVDEIWITTGAGIAVYERGGWFAKAFDRSRRALILGIGAIEEFPRDAFCAVMAHEYAHFLHRDTAGGDVAMRVNASMGRFAQAMANQGSVAWWNVGWQFLRFYHYLFRRITHGASRLHEVNADAVAARAYGGRALESGLRHVIRADIATGKALSRAIDEATMPVPSSPHFRRAADRREVDAAFKSAWEAETSADDTHPSPTERVRLIAELNGGHVADDSTPLRDLFDDPAWIKAEADARVVEATQEQATMYRLYCQNVRQQLDAHLAENPKGAPAYLERGKLRLSQGDNPGAIADFTESIRCKIPQVGFCLFGRGIAHGRMGDVTSASADLRAAIEDEPAMEGVARAELAEIHAKAGDLEAAIRELSRSIELSPDDPELVHRRAQARLDRDEFADAEADFSRVLQLDPRCAEALAGRSAAREARGHYYGAIDDARAALAIEPDLDDARLRLAWMLATLPDDRLRDGREAVALARSARGPEWLARDTVAAALAESGDFRAAIAEAERAAELAPEDEKAACLERRDLYLSGQPYRNGEVLA